MLGIDLVLPDFTWLRENADRVIGCIATHGHEDHVGALSYLLRELSFPIYGSALTLGLARNRIEEAGLLGKTELIPVGRRRAPQDRPVRRRVHPGHPLGAPRLRHRVPHAAGRDHAHRRLEARPHAGRRPPHRPGPHGRHRLRVRHPPPHGRLHQRRLARPLPQREERGRRALRPVPRARGPAHRHRLLRQPHPPRAADRRRRHRVRPQGRHPRHVDEEERAPRPRDGPAEHPRLGPDRHRGHRRPPRRQRLRDLHRQPGRADVGAHPHGQPARTAGSRSARATRSSSARTRSRATR